MTLPIDSPPAADGAKMLASTTPMALATSSSPRGTNGNNVVVHDLNSSADVVEVVPLHHFNTVAMQLEETALQLGAVTWQLYLQCAEEKHDREPLETHPQEYAMKQEIILLKQQLAKAWAQDAQNKQHIQEALELVELYKQCAHESSQKRGAMLTEVEPQTQSELNQAQLPPALHTQSELNQAQLAPAHPTQPELNEAQLGPALVGALNVRSHQPDVGLLSFDIKKVASLIIDNIAHASMICNILHQYTLSVPVEEANTKVALVLLLRSIVDQCMQWDWEFMASLTQCIIPVIKSAFQHQPWPGRSSKC
jgi:hypothetical protein